MVMYMGSTDPVLTAHAPISASATRLTRLDLLQFETLHLSNQTCPMDEQSLARALVVHRKIWFDVILGKPAC